MKIIQQTHLHYQKGTSNKVYNIYLVEVSSENYLVNFEYGRFGGNLKEGSKTTSPVDLTKAKKVFDTLVNSKIKKDYTVDSGFDSSKGKEKKERVILSSDAYKSLLLERLRKAGAVEKNSLAQVDNYEVSHLIYKAGELKIEEAKEIIVKLYTMNTKEENAFYYSVAWALGRYKDPTLRTIIESLRGKLTKASRYIVEEALFAFNEPQEAEHINALILPMQFQTALTHNQQNFIQQFRILSEMIESSYQRYKESLEHWEDAPRVVAKKELMPLLAQADEIYLKFYMLCITDTSRYKIMISIITFLPINEFNFSLFRRLYKMAEFREDYAILAQLITKLESKKLACYYTYDYDSGKYKATIGCSRLYFKKRSLRYLNTLVLDDENTYLEFAKNILLSVNSYEKEFKSFTTEYYDNNWNLKTKKYDAFSTHLTFMSIIYGAGKRYMLTKAKKMWETANSSIKEEHRPEIQKELWDKHPQVALDILSKSTVEVVQNFAFNIIQEHPDVIAQASLDQLLPMLDSSHNGVRKFFFELLQKRYNEHKEEEIIHKALFSRDVTIVDYALEILSIDKSILNNIDLVVDAIWLIQDEKRFHKFVSFIEEHKNKTTIVSKIIDIVESFPKKNYQKRILIVLKKFISSITIEQITYLLSEESINEKHYIALELIRDKEFTLELPLELKEKIATQDDPQMLATTIYLLGKLSSDELMNANEMLISFLYHKEILVHKEAKEIIITLADNKENAKILLQAIIQKSFVSALDSVAENVVSAVEALSLAYGAVNTDQLYRMLIAKSKLALRLGTIILSHYDAKDFSVVQWARLAKNSNKTIRTWAYNAYTDNKEMVQKAMPKSLMIFDTHWEDTREFASKYFENFEPLGADDIVVIADSNYHDVQLFAKQLILERDFDKETIMLKLSQHPALTIQKFVTDLMLVDINSKELLKMERFFNTLLHSVNSNRVAKSRVLNILNSFLEDKEVAKMYARLASHHSATMVWADKEQFVEAMSYIKEFYADIQLPLQIEESKLREVI